MNPRRIQGPYLTDADRAVVEEAVRGAVFGIDLAAVQYVVIGVGVMIVEGLPWWRWWARRRAVERARSVLRATGPAGCNWTIRWAYGTQQEGSGT